MARSLLPGRVFVGRELELDALRRACADARAGRGRVVFVTGEPGIGKTTTVERALAEPEPAPALWGRCHDTGGPPAYRPWIEVLRRWLERTEVERVRRALGEAAPDLARLVPELQPIVGGTAMPGPDDDEAARFRLFDGVTGLLRRAAAEDLLVIVLEDLHWADRESLLLLEWLAPEMRDAHLLVIGTYRESEMRQAAPILLGALARVGDRLALTGLTEREVALFVSAEEATRAPSLAGAIYRLTDGNPFFVTELLELLRAGDRGGTRGGPLRIPDSVRDLIGRRLDPFPLDVREALSVAAVLGPEVHLVTLGEMSGARPAQVLQDLEPALGAGLVHAVPGRAQRFRFSHALVQGALYEGLPASRRAALHQRAGEVIERLHAADLDPFLGELAHHFAHAAGPEARSRAIRYATRAGERAMSRLGFEEAAGHFERALAAVRSTDAEARLALLLHLADAKGFSGDEDGAAAVLIEAAHLARELGAPEALARAALGYAAAVVETGIVNETAVDLLEQALAAVGDGDPPLRANLLSALSRALYFAPDPARRDVLSEEALTVARRTASPVALVAALGARHFALWRAGTAEQRLPLATEAVTRAEQAGQWEVLAEGRAWRILDLFELGAVAEAKAELERHATLAERVRHPRSRWHVGLVRAALALYEGRIADAEAMAGVAAGLRQTGSTSNAAAFWYAQLFFIRRLQGRLGELRDVVRGIAAMLPTLPVWRCGLALLDAETGRPETARYVLEELASRGFRDLPDDSSRLPSLALLAETCALLGDRARAAELAPLLLPHARAHVVIGTTTVLLGPVSRFLGLLALTSGRVADAVAYFETAIAACESAGAAPDLVRSRLGLARALERRGERGDAERAGRLCRLARFSAQSLGLRALLEPQAPAPDRPRAVVRRETAHWTVRCGEEIVRLTDTKGVSYLVTLLRHPGDPIDAQALENGEEATAADPAALERARLNVTRAIGTVLRKITAGSPGVGRHLEASVRTGAACCYDPDTADRLDWDLPGAG